MKSLSQFGAILVASAGLALLSCQTVALAGGSFAGSDFAGNAKSATSGDCVFLVVDGRAACLDMTTGQATWSSSAPGLEPDESPGVGPVVTTSSLVYMANGGFFTAYGLDTKKGKLRWTLDNQSPALVAAGDTVFLSTQGGLGIISIDASSGKINWERRALKSGGTLKKLAVLHDRIYTDSPYVWSSKKGKIEKKLPFDPQQIATNDEMAFFIDSSLSLVALNPANESIKWSAPTLTLSGKPASSVEISASSKYVVATYYNDTEHAATHAVIATFDSTTGKLLWTSPIASEFGIDAAVASVDSDNVYILDPKSYSKVAAYSATNGKALWTYEADGAKFIGPAASSGNNVMIYGFNTQTHQSALYALDKSTGKLRWRYAVESASN